jgi:hypothetical protein
MDMRLALLLLTFILCAYGDCAAAYGQPTATPTQAQDSTPGAAITPTYAFGAVVSIDLQARQILIRTAAGDVTATFAPQTPFVRVPPGELTLVHAQPITSAEVRVGDIVMARGPVTPDKKSVPARQIVLMSSSAIKEKQEREREDWRRRGVAGRVTAINPTTREVTLLARTPAGERPVTLVIADTTVFRRYAPDSVKFDAARPGTFDELKVGEQARALGEKDKDGARLAAEQIVSGSFRMVGGPVLAVDAAKGEVTISDIPTGKPVTVVVNSNSLLRQVPAEVVAALARRTAPAAPASGAGQAPTGQAATGDVDVQEMFDRFPVVTLVNLKPKDLILVSSTVGADPSRVTAILLATGLDPLFSRPTQQPNRRATTSALGLPGGVFDGYIGTP